MEVFKYFINEGKPGIYGHMFNSAGTVFQGSLYRANNNPKVHKQMLNYVNAKSTTRGTATNKLLVNLYHRMVRAHANYVSTLPPNKKQKYMTKYLNAKPNKTFYLEIKN